MNDDSWLKQFPVAVPSTGQRPRAASTTVGTPNQTRIELEEAKLRKAQAEAEMKEKQAQKKRDEEMLARELQSAMNAARQARRLSKNGFMATGFGASTLSNIGGTPAANVAALLRTVGASTALENLQRMRQENPTGAGVGNVSDKDMALLMSKLAALDQAQSDEQFQQQLGVIEKQYADIYTKMTGRPPEPDQYMVEQQQKLERLKREAARRGGR